MLRVRGSSRVLAVLGDPVGHSISPEMQNAAIAVLGLNAVYVALRVSRAELPAVLDVAPTIRLAGNLTIPLKETGASLIADITPEARAVGAVNTFWVEDGAVRGDNTDLAGLAEVLGQVDAPAPWLVCGTGGSARAVAAAAAQAGVPLLVRSRDDARAASFCDAVRGEFPASADCCPDDGRTVGTVINATPLGLTQGDPDPVAPERLSGTVVALDLVYRPGETAWTRACRGLGLRAYDGRRPLVAQGAYAFERFFPGQRAPRAQMRAAVERALRE